MHWGECFHVFFCHEEVFSFPAATATVPTTDVRYGRRRGAHEMGVPNFYMFISRLKEQCSSNRVLHFISYILVDVVSHLLLYFLRLLPCRLYQSFVCAGAAYAASKAAINRLTINWGCEWAKDGIRVNAVAPGATNTPSTESVPRCRVVFDVLVLT